MSPIAMGSTSASLKTKLERTMGRSQFGARIVYGDCLFFTISPNEQHSCLVLRLPLLVFQQRKA